MTPPFKKKILGMIGKNILVDGKTETNKNDFTKKWIEVINQIERNKNGIIKNR